jgi:hypothetical protein
MQPNVPDTFEQQEEPPADCSVGGWDNWNRAQWEWALLPRSKLTHFFGGLAGVVDFQQFGVHGSSKNRSKWNDDVYARRFQYMHASLWELNLPAMDHHMILESTICELIEATAIPTYSPRNQSKHTSFKYFREQNVPDAVELLETLDPTQKMA